MTIASTNVGFSTIAAEKGIGNSNLSLATLAGGQMKLPLPTDSTSTSSEYGTFDQTWYYGGNASGRTGSVVTSAQGQGVNGLNASPHSMSEWVGFDPETDGYSKVGNNTYPAVKTNRDVYDTGCFVVSGVGTQVYCQKVGTVIKIYSQEQPSGGQNGYYTGDATGMKHTGSDSLGTLTEIGRISAGTGQSLPTTCSMSYTTGTNSAGAGWFGSGAYVATVGGGATSTTNLGSTKIGYYMRCGGMSEAGPGTSGACKFYNGVRFTFGGMTGVSGTAVVEVWIHLRAYANHGSGFQSC